MLKIEILFFNSFIFLFFEVFGEFWVFFCFWIDFDGVIDDVFKFVGGFFFYLCVVIYLDDVFGVVDCIY